MDWIPLAALAAIFVGLAAYFSIRGVGLAGALGLAVLPAAGLLAGVASAGRVEAPQERSFVVRARQFAYDPPILRVHRGDRVHLKLYSLDVTHGFHLDGYPVDVEIEGGGKPIEVDFTADQTGKFGFRCSHTCGVFHPFMIGTMIVSPDYAYAGSLGLAVGLFAASLAYIQLKRRNYAGSVAPQAAAA